MAAYEVSNTQGFQAVNLDGATIPDLMAWELVLGQLSLYAKMRVEAANLRLGGQIRRAIYVERSMESLYGRLPDFVKW